MEIINMSKRKLDSLEPMKLPNSVINTESQIFYFSYRGVDKLLKKLYNYDGLAFANKLYTLQAIDSNSSYIPDNFVIPEFLVSINKRIEAFVVPLIKGDNLSVILNDFNISNEEKKYYLKRLGQILEQMKNIRKYTSLTDFYIGDLHEDNLMIDYNKRDIHIVDFDSCKIMGNKSSPSRYLTLNGLLNSNNGKYKKTSDNDALANYEVDENTDIYCYIMIILNYLYNGQISNVDIEEFYKFINYLNDIGVDLNLLESFNRILSNDKNNNPIDFIDTLTPKQVSLARIYKKRINY